VKRFWALIARLQAPGKRGRSVDRAARPLLPDRRNTKPGAIAGSGHLEGREPGPCGEALRDTIGGERPPRRLLVSACSQVVLGSAGISD
jgi:hypothetical protein